MAAYEYRFISADLGNGTAWVDGRAAEGAPGVFDYVNRLGAEG